ncbi:hypothetical protein SHPE106448_05660 [Shewanella pealeana]
MHVTSSGRHGGCKEDKDEQSSFWGVGEAPRLLSSTLDCLKRFRGFRTKSFKSLLPRNKSANAECIV